MEISSLRRMFGMINSENFNMLVDSLKRNGVYNTFKKVLNKVFAPKYPLPADDIEIVKKYAETEMVKGRYAYPVSESPVVSIIVPVYNNKKMTYDCICSVIDSNLSVPTELIVADDCSPESYDDFHEYIPGVKVCKNRTNSGFTLNCNNAAKTARGKYIFFLNNDTLVTKDWLKPLVDYIETHPDVGMVGSKLLFPDGTLQEAGGILWEDGSACNYGRDNSSEAPEYSYVHDVDYISGAAILVRKDLFEKIGGFDPRYAPAYCEDSDLAFELRKMGYRTVLQPFSTIIHFEGMSNGKRVDEGLKQYQITNKEKFFEKWKDVLKLEHYPKDQCAFHARDRSSKKTTILFVEECIPYYDDNAGHRTVYDYLKTLSEMGYNVKYIPNNFFYDPDYVPIYQKMGIEVLYGPYYWRKWDKWIKENGRYIDHVMIYRPHISEKYMDFIRRHTRAKIIYNVADLHYLRLNKEYEVTGDVRYLNESKRMMKKEFSYMRKSDFVGTVSTEEAKIISGVVGKEKVITFPIYCFDDVDSGEHCYSPNNDIVFVGSFSHRPNGDAVLWFVNEVFPIILNHRPDAVFHVIGSNPSKDIIDLSSENVVIEGHVSDEALEEFYRTASVCVIPLRYGAGVKGKFVEALRMKIPIVSTSIGIEGLEGITDYVKPFDDAEPFAHEVLRLMSDREAAKEESERHMEYVKKHFTRESMKNQFISVFGPPLRQ